MPAKVLAILGTYRKGKIIDQAVDAALEAAQTSGAETEKVYLMDKHIEFCTNCRMCVQEEGYERQPCRHNDDVEAILDKIDAADILILASPINFGHVTALTKRFHERLLVYVHWPWGQTIPKPRRKEITKKALVITSSAMPAFLARIMCRHVFTHYKEISKLIGAKVAKTVHFGLVPSQPNGGLTQSQLKKAQNAAKRLIR